MTESISWDGEHLDVKVNRGLPFRACGTDITMTFQEGMTDERGHAIGYVHLVDHVTAFAALHVIHDLHAPNSEGFTPYCPVCRCPAPCETRRATTAALIH